MTPSYVCWQPLLTDHQAFTYTALSELAGGRLLVVVGREVDAIRKAQGWVENAPPRIEKRIRPRRGWRAWARQVLEDHKDDVHVFGSPFEDIRQIWIMAMACRRGLRVILLSEPFSISAAGHFASGGLKGQLKAWLRPTLYRLYARIFSRRIDGVFAISPLACEQYRQFGVPLSHILPFGYFVPSQTGDTRLPASGRGGLRVVFVGNLIERKGLPLALEAVRMLRAEGRDITLDIYGAGDPSLVEGVDGVSYRGITPFGQAGKIIAPYDALVVPSLFDGWAVVVNEALQAGVPVCCSSAVGAGAVVCSHEAGKVFPAGSAHGLRDALRDWLVHPDTMQRARESARRVAPLLDPAVAARYFVQAIASLHGAPRPASPWYRWPDELPHGE